MPENQPPDQPAAPAPPPPDAPMVSPAVAEARRQRDLTPNQRVFEAVTTFLEGQGYVMEPKDPALKQLKKQLREARSSPKINSLHVAAAYAAVYMKIAESRKQLVKDVDKMRAFYLVDVMLNQMTEDALAPETSTGEILNITSRREDIQKEVDYLDEKFDIDQIVLAITPDLLSYGEYVMETEVSPSPLAIKKRQDAEAHMARLQGKVNDSVTPIPEIAVPPPGPDGHTEYGLLELKDNVDQGTIVALTRYNETTAYLERDKQGSMIKHEPADYIKFSLTGVRVRIDLHKELGLGKRNVNNQTKDQKSEFDDIPRYVRVGKSSIYPIIAKLKELELLEALVPATKLSKLSAGTLIGVQVPAGYDIEQAMEAAKKVEGFINKKVGIDDRLGELTIENIMTAAGKLKAVPIFGDKGQLRKLDYKLQEPDDLLGAATDIRKLILTSVGIPYELVFGGEEENKGTILKKYGRYLRRLKAIQKAIEEGVRQILYIHLSNKGIDYKADDIKIEFHNKLIEVDQLDHLEFSDTIIQFLENVRGFVTNLADAQQNPAIAPYVNMGNLRRFLNDNLNTIGFNNFIRIDDLDDDGNSQDDHDNKLAPSPVPDLGGQTPRTKLQRALNGAAQARRTNV